MGFIAGPRFSAATFFAKTVFGSPEASLQFKVEQTFSVGRKLLTTGLLRCPFSVFEHFLILPEHHAAERIP